MSSASIWEEIRDLGLNAHFRELQKNTTKNILKGTILRRSVNKCLKCVYDFCLMCINVFMILPVSNIFSILYCLNTVLGINTFVFISMFKQICVYLQIIIITLFIPFFFFFFFYHGSLFFAVKEMCSIKQACVAVEGIFHCISP